VLSLLLLVTFANGFQSPPACSEEGMECDYDENNLIDSVAQVYSDEECRQICEDQLDCEYITYFNASAKPFSNFCLMFKSCENTTECTNCVTQNMDCYRTCGANVVGRMDENIIDVVANIKSELDCKLLCSGTANCKLYTYYLDDDPLYHQLCVLLTELLPPSEPSDSASTGPADCSSSECSFNVNGDSVKSLMVTEDQVDVTVIAFGSCELTILAVGGGGKGYYGGGGSGYLQYQKILLSTGISSLHAVAGASAQPSSVTFNGTSIVANPGQGGSNPNNGGAGYSGGGQYSSNNGYSGSGGFDGSDGGGDNGGSGTHEDISDYIFTTWTLTPGDGGSAYYSSGHSFYYGGGGGGVLVNSSGPGTDKYKGQGYGGGGNGRTIDGHEIGLPGIILLEISSG